VLPGLLCSFAHVEGDAPTHGWYYRFAAYDVSWVSLYNAKPQVTLSADKKAPRGDWPLGAMQGQ
jgi:hypothetical protein